MPQIRRMQELMHELSSVQAAALPQIRRMHEQLHELSSEIADQKANNREFVAKSRKVLEGARPGTFLGRKTQEPFPKQDHE